MNAFGHVRARLGDYWWYSALLFVALRFGDLINAFIGLWLVPRFVPAEDLGAVLPLTQFAAMLALPMSVFAMTFQKHLNVLSVQEKSGQMTSLLRSVFVAMGALVLVGMFVSWLTMEPVLERLRVERGSLGMLVIASGLIAATVPVYQNALQAMRRFRALTVMSLLGAPIRLVVLVALLPFRALSAYFSAQTATGIWSIGCCVFSLRREIVGTGPRETYWTRENVRSFCRYGALVALYYLSGLAFFVEALVIRQRLPAGESADYYMLSRFAEMGTFLGATLLSVAFPFVSESDVEGRNARTLVSRSVAGTLAFGSLVALVFVFAGGPLLSLFPGGGRLAESGLSLAFLTVILTLGAAANLRVVCEIAADRFGFLWWFLPLHAVYAGVLLFITGYGYFTAWLPAAAVELIQRINGHGLSWMLVAMFVFNLFKLVLSLARR